MIILSYMNISSSHATQTVGLLSYTYLRKTGQDDIIVPMVCICLISSADSVFIFFVLKVSTLLFVHIVVQVFCVCLQVDFEMRDGRFVPLVHNSLDDWNNNLRTILSWSPFPAEDDLFLQVSVWKSSFFYSLNDYSLWT